MNTRNPFNLWAYSHPKSVTISPVQKYVIAILIVFFWHTMASMAANPITVTIHYTGSISQQVDTVGYENHTGYPGRPGNYDQYTYAPGETRVLNQGWGGFKSDGSTGEYGNQPITSVAFALYGHTSNVWTPMRDVVPTADGNNETISLTYDGTNLVDVVPASTNNNDNSDTGNPAPNTPNPCSDSCSSCGMPAWRVSQPYISLWLQDEPLGYQPAVGPRISFKLAFKQRETTTGYNTNWFSVGKKWNFSWLSYVALDSNGSNVVYLSGGGQETFNAPIDYLTNARLTGDTNGGFVLSYADGSQDVYGFIVTNSSGAFQAAFLTARQNAQGQQTTLNYSSYTPTASPIVRLQSVVDGAGLTTFIYYNPTSAYSTNLISCVVDPFGRTNWLSYDSAGHLTNSVDVAGISSSFTYDTNDWVSSLTVLATRS